VAFVAAGVGAVAGVIGLFVLKPAAAPAKEAPDAAAFRIEPTFGIGSLGLRGQF
jgi:hypothetical protein